ncbi:MAG: mannosyltransferase family protein [Gaiellaceae bacterium]
MLEALPDEAQAATARIREWLVARRWIVVWWAGSRGLVIGVALLVHAAGWPVHFFRITVARNTLGLLFTWDSAWYAVVARHGYLFVPGGQSDPAFFPLYPILLRSLNALGLGLGVAGVLISNLAFLVALFAFYELGRALLDERIAKRATTYLAVFPMGFVFSMAYPESLVLAAVSLAGLFALKRRWFLCAVCVAAATLARPEGVLVAIPIGALAVHRWRALQEGERTRALAAVFAGPAVLLSYPLYLGWAVHDAFAWTKAETAWNRSFRPEGLGSAVLTFGRVAGRQPWLWRDLCLCIVYVVLLAIAARTRVPKAWLVMAALMLLLPLTSGSFQSEGRFGLLALPVYWGLAAIPGPRWSERLVQTLGIALLVAATFTLPFVFP